MLLIFVIACKKQCLTGCSLGWPVSVNDWETGSVGSPEVKEVDQSHKGRAVRVKIRYKLRQLSPQRSPDYGCLFVQSCLGGFSAEH